MVITDDRLSPDQSVLGALLIEPKLTGKVAGELNDDDFLSKPARLLWKTIKRLWSEGSAIDPVIIRDRLDDFPEMTQYLIGLMEIVPTAANIDYYIAAAKKASSMARLKEIGQALLDAQTQEEQAALIAKANGITAKRQCRERMGAAEMFRSFAEDHAGGREPNYIRWPFAPLNEQTYTEPGDFIIIAGRPSDGKTAFALVCAWHQSQSARVGFYSLETGPKKIRDRSIAAQACIDMGRIKHNKIEQGEWEGYAAAAGKLDSFRIDVIQAAGMSVDDIFADALAHRYEIIYIDYLQLLRPSNPKETNRVSAVTDISLRIHSNCQRTGILTVALSQLSRASAADGKKPRRPQLTDLRESGQIEQDADTIIFLWRDSQTGATPKRNVFVAKNKEGTIGEFSMMLDGAHQRFTLAATAPALPRKAKEGHPTPVIGKTEEDQLELKPETGEDPGLPF